MLYNHLSEYLTSQGYVNNELCPYVFIKKSHSGFAIVAVYVDDMNLIGTPAELEEITVHLKSKFEMKDLGKTQYCLGLEIEHCSDGILVHQSYYTQKVLRYFNEDKGKPLSAPIPDISVTVNLLAKYSNAPTHRHLNSVKAIFYYFKGTTNLGYFYTHKSSKKAVPPFSSWVDSYRIGYADVGYLFDPHSARSQADYLEGLPSKR
ncbi:uncharacterized mitochondrial protein AtMg00810-like [Malus domestica]|uniref:uncharacterized mitochondrial protein AtMg00810-like n=1 Tax=Malus domestica TaxID=3750 RepID=UPI003976DFF2